MERKDNNFSGNEKTSWQTSEKALGTPGEKNSPGEDFLKKDELGSEKFEKINQASLSSFLNKPEKIKISQTTLAFAGIISLFSGLIIFLLKRSLRKD